MTTVGWGGDTAVAAGSGSDEQRSVLVRVGATAAHLAPLRVVAGELATRADFDLDSVADLRMAVDEAAAELVGIAAPGSMLTSIFLVDEEEMEVTLSVPSAPGSALRYGSFGWRVLSALVDGVRVLHDEEGEAPVTGIVLRKKRAIVAEGGTDRR